MPITSLTSYYNTTFFGDTNTYTQNQKELALTLDSAAHELGNWRTLVSMSAGGAAFEGGQLAATALFGSFAPLAALPFIAKAFSFAVGAVSDTGLTTLVNQALGNEEGDESFLEKLNTQGTSRLVGLMALGQSFAVMQVMQGVAGAAREAMGENSDGKKQGGMLRQIITGLQCYFGSGMFAGFTGGIVNAAEQRISLKTRHVNVGANPACPPVVWRVFAQNKGRSQGSPLLLTPLPEQGLLTGKPRAIRMQALQGPQGSSAITPEKLGRLLEQAPCAVLITNKSEEIVYANAEALRFLGSDLRGKKFSDILETATTLSDAPEMPRYRPKDSDHSDLSLEARSKPFEEDLTAHFLWEVGKLEKAMIDTVGGIMHDAQAPVRIASSYTGLAVTTLKGLLGKIRAPTLSNLLERLETAQTALEKAYNLQGRWRLILTGSFVKIPIFTLVMENVEIQRELFKRQKITITTDIEENIHIYGRRQSLDSVVTNLLVNAQEAMPQGGSIRVKVFAQDEMAVIEVADTGSGILPENKARIFERGFTTKGIQEGRGIGLYLLKQKVVDHQGNIDFESEVGQGTTFRVRLPLVRNGKKRAST